MKMIVDDVEDIGRRLRELERKKELDRATVHPDIIPEAPVGSYMGHQWWSDEQVMDGNSPPIDQLKQIVASDGRSVWVMK